MGYDRIVSAALAETKSKFELAEALALDIPPKRRGPTDPDEQSVQDLRQAREAIITAGGEHRNVRTLDTYRATALWVSTNVGRNFQWVQGTSFTAHSEARATGMTYEQFTAMPKPTVDVIRREAG